MTEMYIQLLRFVGLTAANKISGTGMDECVPHINKLKTHKLVFVMWTTRSDH